MDGAEVVGETYGMSDPQQSGAASASGSASGSVSASVSVSPSAAPPPTGPGYRRRPPFPVLLVSLFLLALLGRGVYSVWSDYFRTISRQTAYDRVTTATQTMVTSLGQDPARHPAFVAVDHCDNGMGGYHHWEMAGSASIDVTPDQAVPLTRRLESVLVMTGHFAVKRTVVGSEVTVSAHLDHTDVFLSYQPSQHPDRLDIEARTKCEVAVGPHDDEHDAGYPLTDDQGHLLPSPGYGPTTGW